MAELADHLKKVKGDEFVGVNEANPLVQLLLTKFRDLKDKK